MFWNRRKHASEMNRWIDALEAGIQDDPTLEIAARLQAIHTETTTTNPFFKARLREQLVALHDETLPKSDAMQTTSRANRRRLWHITPRLLLIVIILSLLVYWQRQWWMRLLGWQIDDWQYTPITAMINAIDLSTAWTHATMAPLIGLIVMTVGTIFGLCLLYLLLQQVHSWWQPAYIPTRYWLQVARKGMWVSGMAGILLVGLTTFAWQHLGTPVTHVALRGSRNVSPIIPQANLERIPTPLALPATIAAKPDVSDEVVVGSQALQQSVQAPAASNAAPNIIIVPASSAPASIVDEATIGLAVGGAKDINNFRENIAQGYLPLPTDVTVEGLFYDYYFATGQREPCTQLFCPSYAQATSRDPISGEPQHFLSVGLNSGLTASDFARKRLNLVIVLDISGSMGEEFTRYHYDSNVNAQATDWEAKPKIAAATEAITAILDQLNPDDRLGIVLFDDQAHLAKQMRAVGQTNMANIKQHILALREQGGTNMEAGYRLGSDLLTPLTNADPTLWENRMIFLTDAQPNTGAVDQTDLLALAQRNAEQRIYTTFIGVGVDFNTELVEGLTKVKGANYYAVHSPNEFMRRMGEEFAFMVTPLLFDLTLTFNSSDFTIDAIYGSPEADVATGELMRINTLFPSASSNGEVKGGLVLLQLRSRNGNAAATGQATLTATYTDRTGAVQSSAATIALTALTGDDRYDNLGIRKGVLLVRYANLLRNWINDTRHLAAGGNEWLYPSVTPARGIPLPQSPNLGQWERQSLPLEISPAYRELFAQFERYLLTEMALVEDGTLQQEIDLLQTIIAD